MFAASKTDSVSGETPDPQFNYVTMLLHGDGTNGAQNNTFLDSSTNNFTITRNGNTTQGSFSPYGSNWSNYFSSANFFYSASNAAFAFGTGDFTVEAWVKPNSYGTLSYVLGVAVTDGLVFYVNSGNLVVRAYNTGDLLSSSTIPAIGSWTHVAATRSGTTLRIFVNGVQTATTTNSTNFAQGAIYAGNDSSNAAFWNGYISNLRVVKGTAVYTSNFTPSTAPLTAISGTSWLVSQSNRFVDNSANNFAIITSGTPSVQRFNPFGTSTAYSTSVVGGSGYFDGSGDYLQIANNTALDVGTGAFTLEGWMYRTSASFSDWRMFGPSSGNGGFFGGRAGKLGLGRSAVAWDLESSTNQYNNDAWTHVVYVRDGSGNLSIFSNGVRVANTTGNTYNYGLSGGNLQIGAEKNSELFGGFLSNTRLVKGTAVYDPTQTTLIVPTAPLTAVSGTGYLGFFTNGAIFDNAMINNLETVGAAQISTSVVKYGTGSLYMNASTAGTDYFVQPSSESVNFATGNFTIEFWMNPISVVTSWGSSDLATIMDTDAPVGTSVTWWVVHQNDASIMFATNSAAIVLSSSVLSANVWQHVAIVRNGSTITIYVNGTSAGSATYTNTIGSARRLTIGTQLGSVRWYKGYLDDIRITNGYARYTANFTPPTAAFFNKGPY
jgi:hypothetical protein